MKIRVTLKDPDMMSDAVADAVAKEVKGLTNLNDRERQIIQGDRICEVQSDISEKWMEYGEYLVVEFDTDAGTATVIPWKSLSR